MNRKHSTLVLLLLIVVAMLATACGKNNSASPSDSVSPSSSESASPVASEPVASTEPAATTKKITDGLGRDVEIPVHAQRIVVLGNYGEVTNLGVKPVGTIGYYLDKYGEALTAGVENLGQDEADLEAMLALDPDLIIIPSYFTPELLEAYSKIAPTVATQWGLSPLEHFAILADWLDRKAEEQVWLDNYAKKVAEVKEQLKPFNVAGQKAVVIQFWSNNIYQHATNVFSPLFNDIGFVPTEAEAAVTATAAISQEAVVDYVGDADRLFILVDGQADIDVYNGLKDTVWKNIPAIKSGKVYLVDSPRWNDFSTTAMEWILDDLTKVIVD
ncbi:MAG: ABC transporter substrate-binding protein [Candidatus Cohnella colombiensis]|uniref:ABC transporter substrate-binding protein n=1 Tax=Candidatus Cohnella colombiensis TaxID=3121368 RepID=A0AA95EZ37_9BACL|nr:MAG: ABC transporter substrate-binding protein [Cohnella sp.]